MDKTMSSDFAMAVALAARGLRQGLYTDGVQGLWGLSRDFIGAYSV